METMLPLPNVLKKIYCSNVTAIGEGGAYGITAYLSLGLSKSH